MSLYCQNKNCPKHEECLRYESGKKYQGQTIEGLWWVSEYECSQKNKFDYFAGKIRKD